jgi:hypothetical protein
VACRYLGYETRVYPQYLDLTAGGTLIADPGGEYDLAAAGSLDLPVPPADGLWEAAEPDPPGSEDSGDSADGGSLPPPLMTGTSTEGEEN